MILACNHITKSFADEVLLKDASFHINDTERAAIIGANGTGKTTLLKIIMDIESADEGEIIKSKDKTYGYLPQQSGYHSDNSIYDELLSVKQSVIEMDKKLRDLEESISTCQDDTKMQKLLDEYNKLQTTFENSEGYSYKSDVLGVIHGLGFDNDSMHKCINHLSGGQKTRVALGKLLLTKPDLLILDEPTNHLDLEAIKWLENYLNNYKGAVLVVSHDRFFLDKISNKIIELENKKITMFTGNYSDYSQKKDIIRKSLINEYNNQQQKIKHQEEVITKLKQFNREKSIKRAESREKMLDKIERIEKPFENNDAIHFELTPRLISGNDVLAVNGFKKAFDTNLLFENIDFEIKRGEKVAIIGQNGTGKTTLLKMLCDMEPVTDGIATIGANVEIGYYDQEHNVLDDEKTIFEEIQDTYPDLNNTQIRNVLAAFLFTGDDVFKTIKLLSGGEKGRVSLAKIMLSNANFLLLDEPTNHLDIVSKEILENAINNYTGTVLYVSHDRYFINKTATRILDLTDKKLLSYNGNYSYYLEKKETMEQVHNVNTNPVSTQKNNAEGKLNWEEQKKLAKEKKKLETEYNKVEKLIETLESEIEKLDEELNNPAYATNAHKLMELTTEKEEKEAALIDAMDQWEQLATKLDQ